MEKKVDITGRYQQEILDIKNKLIQLENGRIFELSGAKMDGSLSTNIDKLRRMIAELIYKVEYGEDSTIEEIQKSLKKIDF